MHAKWLPTKENIEIVVRKISPEKLYTRQQALDELGISGSVFDRYIRLNSMWLAYGKPVIAGRMTIYPGEELVLQFRRLEDPTVALRLFDLFYHASEEEFQKEIGVPRDEVFAEGTYLTIGGWKGINY